MSQLKRRSLAADGVWKFIFHSAFSKTNQECKDEAECSKLDCRVVSSEQQLVGSEMERRHPIEDNTPSASGDPLTEVN